MTVSFYAGWRSRVKHFLLRYKYIQELERAAFNRRTDNHIYSPEVSLKAIKGQHITAQSGTLIDENCTIDSYAYIGYNCFVTKTIIGRYASIGNNVSIGPGEHKVDRIANAATLYEEENIYGVLTILPCTIGPDAWIGVDSIMRRGTEVGVGAVVGANSFVNENVPPYTIVAGTPARLIRYRFSPAQIQLILESHWWELEMTDARIFLRELAVKIQGID